MMEVQGSSLVVRTRGRSALNAGSTPAPRTIYTRLPRPKGHALWRQRRRPRRGRPPSEAECRPHLTQSPVTQMRGEGILGPGLEVQKPRRLAEEARR
jgi:hypothetical protein